MEESARKEAANSPEQAVAPAVMPGRRWRRALVPFAGAAAVIAVAVGAVVITSGSPARQAAGAAPSASAAPGISRTAPSGAPTPYRVAGSVTMKLSYLDCITADSEGWIDQVSCATERECVVHISGGLTRDAFLSTTNGGLSWTAATRLPSGALGSLSLLRCDRSGRCIGAVSAGQGTASVPPLRGLLQRHRSDVPAARNLQPGRLAGRHCRCEPRIHRWVPCSAGSSGVGACFG